MRTKKALPWHRARAVLLCIVSFLFLECIPPLIIFFFGDVTQLIAAQHRIPGMEVLPEFQTGINAVEVQAKLSVQLPDSQAVEIFQGKECVHKTCFIIVINTGNTQCIRRYLKEFGQLLYEVCFRGAKPFLIL